MAAVRHYHHHYHFSYTTSLKRHLSSIGIVVIFLVVLSILGFSFTATSPSLLNLNQLSLLDILSATLHTLVRLTAAYLICLVLSVPLALFITSTPKVERILLPLFDIIQSIPILAFFPLIVLVFIKLDFFEGAAIFVLVMSMLWTLVFSMIGGLKTIPEDIKSASLIFHAKGFKKLRYITLPSIFPYIITGSLLSWAGGWNILIVAEVLHTYIPNGKSSQDLFGLGSLLVNSIYQGKNSIFLASIICMIILIGLMNFFIWQKMLHFVERYKFD